MKKIFLSLLGIVLFFQNVNCQQVDPVYLNTYPVYKGNDLGTVYKKSGTTVRVYAPTAEVLRINLYKSGDEGEPYSTLPFNKDLNGTWVIKITGDQVGKFFTVQAKIKGNWHNEVTDPYAKAVGVNGNRVQIIDFAKTNPVGWEIDKSPVFTRTKSMQDAIIYELHLRDVSMDPSSGIKNKGKFLGLAELNTKTKTGESTGLSHIKELGVTHVHLLPFFDYNSVDEKQLNLSTYNWGYDPKNFNAVEGSYSTNPVDVSVRIKELKTMVVAMHTAGLRVVMDVVYNHTAVNKLSNFHQLVPGYYHRMKNDTIFADASACGNETASEHPMMRKFMIESVLYWVKEFHIDGFRFDLMAIHDIETMNQIAKALRAVKPDILIYGEGWAAGSPNMPQEKLAFKRYVGKLDSIAVFSDDIRDGIKGYVFDSKAKGFVNGNPALTETVKFGIVGAMSHPQVNMQKAFWDKVPYASAPGQVINYADCHDNLALWDKLAVSAPDATIEERIQMQEMAMGIVLTSQGIPFFLAGSEFLRTKKGVENSFNSPDSINAIDWNLKAKNLKVFKFVQQLIQIRKSHPLFRLQTAVAIREQLSFIELPDGVIAYTIQRKNEKDLWKSVMVVCNSLGSKQEFTLPGGAWKVAISNTNPPSIDGEKLTVEKLTLAILYLDK